MKAIVYDRYGTSDVLAFSDVDEPAVGDDQVLVRVRAAGVNPYDWHFMTGVPYFMRAQAGLRRPKQRVLGIDFAGVVAAVGAKVTRFSPGDEVFGTKPGAFAEYVCVSETGMVVAKPSNVTFEQAAATPMAGLTALQGLRDKGRIRSGQRVLINGASGGVGTFAVQLAKGTGAHVTGVCSTRNLDLVRSLGADAVIDYTRQDFTRSGGYDLILDAVCTRSIADRRRALSAKGLLVSAAGPKTNRWLGPAIELLRVTVAARLGRANFVPLMTQLVADDLATLRELLEAGTLSPVIERTYPLVDAPKALTYQGSGHVPGKLVLVV